MQKNKNYTILEISDIINKESYKFRYLIVSDFNYKKFIRLINFEIEFYLQIVSLLKDLNFKNFSFFVNSYILNNEESTLFLKKHYSFEDLNFLADNFKKNNKFSDFTNTIIRLIKNDNVNSLNSSIFIQNSFDIFAIVFPNIALKYKTQFEDLFKFYSLSNSFDLDKFLKEVFDIFNCNDLKLIKFENLDCVEEFENSLIVIDNSLVISDAKINFLRKFNKNKNSFLKLEGLKDEYESIYNLKDYFNDKEFLSSFEVKDKIKTDLMENLNNTENFKKIDILNEGYDINLSNTSVKNYIYNPYFFFVSDILKLKPIEKINSEDLNSKDKGLIIHKICEEFAKYCSNKNNQINEKIFFSVSKNVLKGVFNINLDNNFYWLYLLNKIKRKLIEIEIKARESGFKIEIEKFFSFKFADNFNLKCSPDRIEYLNDRDVKVFDFKTGSEFSKNSELNGANPQFAIMAIILEEGFNLNVIEAEYVFLLKNKSLILDRDYIQKIKKNALQNIKNLTELIKNSKTVNDFIYLKNNSFLEYENQTLMEYFARKKIAY